MKKATRRLPWKRGTSIAATLGLGIAAPLLLATSAQAATVVDVYDAINDPHPSYSPSLAYETWGIVEFGQTVALGGAARDLANVEVGFVNWGCETGFYWIPDAPCTTTTPGASFTHPITVTLYEDLGPGVPGPQIATLTDTVTVPFRPSADPVNCLDDPSQYQDAAGICRSGVFFTWVFDFSSLGITVPDQFTVGVSYNTSTSGYAPIGTTPIPGTNASYDVLNVAIVGDFPPAVGGAVDQFLYATMAGGGIPSINVGWGDLYTLQVAVRALEETPSTPGLPASGSTDTATPMLVVTGIALLAGMLLIGIGGLRRRASER